MFPCNECAKIIIQSGVSEVIYFVEKRLKKFRYCICCLSQATVIGWCKVQETSTNDE
ncbi:hypothetical protein JHK87_047070 [Glycine soja]|nr:hypothetical protein JHK87_047070 [Glycine soja]